jgi:hypothetical protein
MRYNKAVRGVNATDPKGKKQIAIVWQFIDQAFLFEAKWLFFPS